METNINLPFITSDAEGPKHLEFKITRAQFDSMTNDLIERSIDRVKKTIDEIKLDKNEIKEVILVGGTTLIPAAQDAVKNFFNKEPNKSINPEEVVAIGAAIEAEILTAKEEGRTPEGDIKSVLLLDVLPLSLGIETLGNISTPMIAKNTTIPTSGSQIFSTAVDNQTSVEINVLQGERSMAKDNRSLGKFILDGIPMSPRGIPQVEVKFDIDANGILTVTAIDKASNKSQSIKVEGSIGLSKEEIEKMKKDAEMNAADDQKKREVIESKNIAENLIYQSEKTLKEGGDKVPAEAKKEVEDRISELKKVKDGDNMEEIKKKTEELSHKPFRRSEPPCIKSRKNPKKKKVRPMLPKLKQRKNNSQNYTKEWQNRLILPFLIHPCKKTTTKYWGLKRTLLRKTSRRPTTSWPTSITLTRKEGMKLNSKRSMRPTRPCRTKTKGLNTINSERPLTEPKEGDSTRISTGKTSWVTWADLKISLTCSEADSAWEAESPKT
jgi:hypothetical protein